MALVNENHLKLKAGYLFPEIARRVKAFTDANPQARPLIRMGLGDVTEPLPPAVIDAMHRAVDEMSHRESFRGYGPPQGYDFLRHAIATNDFQARGCDISADEVFVSDGAKSDLGNILDLFSSRNIVAIPDPVYPVYVDSNVMAGTTGPLNHRGEYDRIVYLPATVENGFVPEIPRTKVDIVYLCSPNNPTGSVIRRDALTQWVNWARDERVTIFFDSAYEGFITDDSIPHSIFEIPGAREVAIEFRSFSKLAGFTGLRAGFTVVPKSLLLRTAADDDNDGVELHRLWHRRHATKFQGISYVVSRAAEAVYSPAGREQCRVLINHYLGNAQLIRERLASAGLSVFGGEHGPYAWVKTPGQVKSWDFFELLLGQANVICTPGLGFGLNGEGYVRLTAFNSRRTPKKR